MKHSDWKAQPQRGSRAGVGGLLALAMVGLLTVAGCTGGNSLPTISDMPSTSPSSSTPAVTTESTPETTAVPIYKPGTDQGPAENVPIPVLPEEAKEFSKEGLIAFSEHWYQTLGYLYETGDSEPMTGISDPSCKTCAFVIEPLVQLYKEGGWAAGGQMKVYESSSQFVPSDEGTYTAMLMVQQMKVTAYTAEGDVANDYPQRRARTNIVVASFQDQKWRAITAEPVKEN